MIQLSHWCAQLIRKDHWSFNVSPNNQFFFTYMLIFIYFDSPRSQQFVETEKISVMGHTFSSKAEIICSRLDTRSDNPIICVCKVCASFYNYRYTYQCELCFCNHDICMHMCITCYFAMNKKNFAMRIDTLLC